MSNNHPKHIYIAYVTGNSQEAITRLIINASTIFAVRGVSLAVKNVTADLVIISVTSESPLDHQLLSSFEDMISSNKHSDILFSYFSEEAVYLYSLIVFYKFGNKQYLSANNFRRELAYAVYDLITARVMEFNQSTNSTSIVLCSSVPIPDKEIAAVLAKTNAKQVTTTISFKSF